MAPDLVIHKSVEKIIEKLSIPENQRGAFYEIYKYMINENKVAFQDWNTFREHARTCYEVKHFLDHDEDIFNTLSTKSNWSERTKQISIEYNIDHSKVHQLIYPRFLTAAIYSPDESLNNIMDNIIELVLSSVKKKKEYQLELNIKNGKFQKAHKILRKKSYLYKPIFYDDGDLGRQLIEARDAANNELLGYILNVDNYIYDIAIDPDYSGYNIAIYLLFALAMKMKEQGYESITLDVRRHNHTAIQFYRKCGFEFEEDLSNYNWHGGIALSVKVEKLLELKKQYIEKNIIKEFEVK